MEEINILTNATSITDEDIDLLFEEIENDEELNKIRENKIKDFKKQLKIK